MELLKSIREMDGARISELSARHDLAKRTIHGRVSTLEEAGYLIKDDDESFVGWTLD